MRKDKIKEALIYIILTLSIPAIVSISFATILKPDWVVSDIDILDLYILTLIPLILLDIATHRSEIKKLLLKAKNSTVVLRVCRKTKT